MRKAAILAATILSLVYPPHLALAANLPARENAPEAPPHPGHARGPGQRAFPCKETGPPHQACPVSPDGLTTISGRVGSRTVVVQLQTAAVHPPPPGERENPKYLALFLECTGDSPCSLTLMIRVQIDHHPIGFPLGVYPYGDIHDVWFEPLAGGLTIAMAGGDTSNSYVVRYDIAGGRLVRQRVYDGMDETRALITTTYAPPLVIN